MAMQPETSAQALPPSLGKLSLNTAEFSGLSALNRTVWNRRTEYLTSKEIRVKIGTWNVAAIQGTEKDVAGWFVRGKGVMQALSGLKKQDNSGNEVESINDQEARRRPDRSTLPFQDAALVPGGKDIGLYVLGLQEIVDVASATEALRPYHDKSAGERWKSAVLAALPKGYSMIAEQQLVGMYLLIYAAPDVAASISNVSCKSTGTGLLGYMGNKGAVSVRIVLGEMTKLVFVNSHLSAGAQPQNLDRRNWDADQITSKTRFDPINRGHGVVDELGDGIGEEDFAFWFGDLNYRLANLPGDEIRRLLARHTADQYERDAMAHASDNIEAPLSDAVREPGEGEQKADEEEQDRQESDPGGGSVSGDELDPESDPASLATTISSLLPHDELGRQMREKLAFHQGWREGKIRFMPTYKYDVGSVGKFDSSEKKRAPSWCDRILYRTAEDMRVFKERATEQTDVRSPSQSRASTTSDSTSFDYDPETDEYNPEDDTPQTQSTGGQEKDASRTEMGSGSIELEYYTSHQRVLSSDHKPLDAVFKLTYATVDPARKAVVYQEVARDFDRRENESQPDISVAVETAEGKSSRELVDFGETRFGRRVSRAITLANTGQVDASFGFVMWDANGHERPWLHVECDHVPCLDRKIVEVGNVYVLRPGEACTATITFHVTDAAVARRMVQRLETVLVLRVLDGRDHFLTLEATWLRTTLGLSVDELIRLPEAGVRAAQAVGEGSGSTEVQCSAPRELFRLTEALETSLERAVAESGMKGSKPPWEDSPAWPFVLAGDGTEKVMKHEELLDRIQELVDTNQSLDIGNVEPDSGYRTELYACVLARFLESLHDGIVDQHMWPQLREEMIVYEKDKRPPESKNGEEYLRISEVLSVSTARNVSFQHIVDTLRRIVAEIAAAQVHGVAVATDNAKQYGAKRSQLEQRFAEFFQRLIFRPRDGEDGNSGKEATRNAARRTAILAICMDASQDSRPM